LKAKTDSHVDYISDNLDDSGPRQNGNNYVNNHNNSDCTYPNSDYNGFYLNPDCKHYYDYMLQYG
jgi:hypothetical protein